VIKDFGDVFIANKKYFNLDNKKVTLHELQKHPILMLDRNSTTSEFVHHIFQQHQLDLVPEIELSSNDLLIDLAIIGLGIAFIPDYCVPVDSSDLYIVDLEEVLPKRQIVVVHNQHLPVSQAAEKFIGYF
jgi:DNA-binding transcriptional LysR family regulator